MSNEELVAEIQAGATERMGELWEQVVGLIKWKACHVMTALEMRGSMCGVELEDLIQSGYLALVKAVETYEADAGTFSTWLIYHLKNTFAEATGYRTKCGKNEPLNNSFSLDKAVDDESDGTPFGEFIPDPKAAATMLSIEEKLWREQLHEALEIALKIVPQRYRDILRLRFYQDMTLEEVSELRGISKERIRQMENRGLRILREPANAVCLRPFYYFDFFRGIGLGAFRYSGMSIQERYLIIEEERQEQERKRQKEWEQAQQNREKRIHEEYQNLMDQCVVSASDRVARMTPEEKLALLEKYGYV